MKVKTRGVKAEPMLEERGVMMLGELRRREEAGWIDLPLMTTEELEEIERLAKKIRAQSEAVVCVGVGGSYLGHFAVGKALGKKEKEMIYSGKDLDEGELIESLAKVRDKDFSVIVMSKSGETLEVMVALQFWREKVRERYGEEGVKERIFIVTGTEQNTLTRELSFIEKLLIPKGVGGRYSVLSAMGLLPLAVAGVDIRELVEGAREEREKILEDGEMTVMKYVAARQVLYSEGWKVEVMASFCPRMEGMIEWWKQLFGESEGKEEKGVFPAGMIFTRDLHSLGQYLQDGDRVAFETFLKVREEGEMTIPKGEYGGLTLAELNRRAEEATIRAHERNLPIIEIELGRLEERNIGAAIYFFEIAAAVSAGMMGVDPFNQPGVEQYKAEIKKEGTR